MNITGPFKDCVRLLTVIAINKPSEITRGSVIKQNVNVNLNGGTFLNQMKNALKTELLEIVSERIKGSSFDFTGDIQMDPYTQSLS